MNVPAIVTAVFCILVSNGNSFAFSQPSKTAGLSAETETCIDCHDQYTPGIVADWRSSRHARNTPGAGLALPELERRLSAITVPQELENVAVGCFECHGLHGGAHADRFEHFGFDIHIVVSPGDCKTCHPKEVDQYAVGKKAYALANLEKNPVYHALLETTLRLKSVTRETLAEGSASPSTKSETCYACHGTRVEVAGTRTVETEAGPITVPVLTNWPNQGVGRVNPDGTTGSCTACHARHAFSIELARKPMTCGECHLEPDVPAYNVYKESKHGNIEESSGHRWNWENVPWKVGEDLTAPSCATCHNSLLVSPGGTVIGERTHDFGARLWTRIFGLIYSHPQPASGATSEIVNADGLPLPTTFSGTPALSYLISADEQGRRMESMKKVCASCHGPSWREMHFTRFDSTIAETDRMTLAATQLVVQAWEKKLADKVNPFDEAIEQLWVRQWLFYANSVRYASAMAGPDYASFKNGWWEMTTNLKKMHDAIHAPKKK